MDRPGAIRIRQLDKIQLNTGDLYQNKKGADWSYSYIYFKYCFTFQIKNIEIFVVITLQWELSFYRPVLTIQKLQYIPTLCQRKRLFPDLWSKPGPVFILALPCESGPKRLSLTKYKGLLMWVLMTSISELTAVDNCDWGGFERDYQMWSPLLKCLCSDVQSF